jgi:rRNA maturation RNase YbeY
MILNRQHEVRVARRALESFLRRVKRELGISKSNMTICFVSDAEMARLNQNFRKRKGPTDVLSFPQENSFSPLATRLRRASRGHSAWVSPGRGGKQRSRGRERTGTRHESENVSPLATRHSPLYLGDIAISPATARRYAKKHARKVALELRVLMLHGVLHLLGFDHETDKGEMDRIEQKLRRRFGLT